MNFQTIWIPKGILAKGSQRAVKGQSRGYGPCPLTLVSYEYWNLRRPR